MEDILCELVEFCVLSEIHASEGGFPLFAETTRSEFATTRWLAEQFPVIVWVRQFNEHRPSWSFKQR